MSDSDSYSTHGTSSESSAPPSHIDVVLPERPQGRRKHTRTGSRGEEMQLESETNHLEQLFANASFEDYKPVETKDVVESIDLLEDEFGNYEHRDTEAMPSTMPDDRYSLTPAEYNDDSDHDYPYHLKEEMGDHSSDVNGNYEDNETEAIPSTTPNNHYTLTPDEEKRSGDHISRNDSNEEIGDHSSDIREEGPEVYTEGEGNNTREEEMPSILPSLVIWTQVRESIHMREGLRNQLYEIYEQIRKQKANLRNNDYCQKIVLQAYLLRSATIRVVECIAAYRRAIKRELNNLEGGSQTSLHDILSTYDKMSKDIEGLLEYRTSKTKTAVLAACSATRQLVEYRFKVLESQRKEITQKEKEIMRNYVPILYKGSNYIENMIHDTDFLAGSVEIARLLRIRSAKLIANPLLLQTSLHEQFHIIQHSDALLQMVETGRLIDFSNTLPCAYTEEQQRTFGEASTDLIDPFSNQDGLHVWPKSEAFIDQYTGDKSVSPFDCKFSPSYAEMEDYDVIKCLKTKHGRTLVHWVRADFSHFYLTMEKNDIERYNTVSGNVEYSQLRGSKAIRHHAADLLSRKTLVYQKAAKRFSEFESYAVMEKGLLRLQSHIKRQYKSNHAKMKVLKERNNADLKKATIKYQKQNRDYIAPIAVSALSYERSLCVYDGTTSGFSVSKGPQTMADTSLHFSHRKSKIFQQQTTVTEGLNESASTLPMLSSTNGSKISSKYSHNKRNQPGTITRPNNSKLSDQSTIADNKTSSSTGSIHTDSAQAAYNPSLKEKPSSELHPQPRADVSITKYNHDSPDWNFIYSVYNASELGEQNDSSPEKQESEEPDASQWRRPVTSFNLFSVDSFTDRVQQRLSALKQNLSEHETSIAAEGTPKATSPPPVPSEIPETMKSTISVTEHCILPQVRFTEKFSSALLEAKNAIHALRKLTPNHYPGDRSRKRYSDSNDSITANNSGTQGGM